MVHPVITIPNSEKKPVTWEEFRNIELDDNDPFIYELINGEIMKRTAPSLLHQRASGRLITAINNFLEEHPMGEAFTAPIDMGLDEHNGLQPDLVFISKERSFLIEDGDYIKGTPDLVVEIISPGYVRRDRVEKKDIYERFAVREYWLIDPTSRTVEIYAMRDNAYYLHSFLEKEGKAVSIAMTGFEIEISRLFE